MPIIFEARSIAWAATLCLAIPASAQTGAPSAPAAPGQPETAGVAAPLTGPQIIQLLDDTIDWYRTLGAEQQAANEPSDLLILYDNRQTASQVIAAAFAIARSDADILARKRAGGDAAASSASQSLGLLQNKFAAQASAVQAELDSDRAKLASARGEQRARLQAKIAELQGDLDLIDARKSLLQTMSTFSSQSDGGGFSASSLRAQIDAMAVTVPGGTGTPAGPAPTTPSAAPTPAAAPASTLTGIGGIAAARFGIWDLASNVVRLSEKAATVSVIDQRTAALQNTFVRIRSPLIAQLKALSARGDALAAQADAVDSATLNRVGGQLDELSNEFKESSALLIPLSKEVVLLGQYRRNLGNWHAAIDTQYHDALRTLGVRTVALAVLLAIVFAAAEIWRMGVVRYIQDARRRYQFLLLRRISLWGLVIVIVGLAFASELGSVVTFAGLITAGLAVAMQGVLMSIVGYFFLIGKYGIRIGDRVQIGDVTGEVIDLGLVRMHLMELGGHGTLGPTGRVVGFANSVVFQVSSGLFKQIHGVSLVWREITLSLPDGVDFSTAKSKLTEAVTQVLQVDHAEIMRQTQEIRKATASNSMGDAHPRVQLGFSSAGIEAHIRYPVHLQNAAETDERVSQSVLSVVRELKADGKAAHPGGS